MRVGLKRRSLVGAALAAPLLPVASLASTARPPAAGGPQAKQPPAAAPSLASTWASFAAKFVQTDGRVVDSGNKGITHTEGLGVAMLAAQALDDRARFDALFGFAQQLKRPDGLYSWKWVPGQGVADRNNASDGDLYIAWALMRAGVRWRRTELIAQAQALAAAVRQHCVVKSLHGLVLLPGVEGFVRRSPSGVERAVVNPSYWVFPALHELQAVDDSPQWAQLGRDAVRLLEGARFGTQGLPADWLLLEDPVLPWQERPARFGYEAIRIPLFLAWSRHDQHSALKACARHMQQPGFAAWQALDGPERAGYAAPVGFEAIARLARRSVFGQPFALPATLDDDYYSASLVLFAALAATDLGLL